MIQLDPNNKDTQQTRSITANEMMPAINKSSLIIVMLLWSVTFVLVTAGSFDFSANATSNHLLEAAKQTTTATTQKHKLLDFAHYQQVFHKHYKSLIEMLLRRSYFIPRALRVLSSKIAYRLGRKRYKLELNELSDMTPKELKRMQNHSSELGWLKQHQLVQQLTRRKRSLTLDGEYQQKQQVSPALLREQIKPAKLFQLGAGPICKQTLKNPEIKRKKSQMRSEIKRTSSSTAVGAGQQQRGREAPAMAIDHSQSGCMGRARNQGECGSCWAFASIAIVEWLFCQANEGELMEFSEQYLIDCSSKYFDTGNCEGGTGIASASFLHNFGLMLASDYPYTADHDYNHNNNNNNNRCPIEHSSASRPKHSLAEIGYIRFESDSVFVVPQSLWEEQLHYGPLYVVIYTDGTDFHEYGEGVHKLRGCANTDDISHAMVLVGWGREDEPPAAATSHPSENSTTSSATKSLGKKFWKLRNSFGAQWGEQGYYRVSQDSSKCIRNFGLAFATNNVGRDLQLDQLFQFNFNYTRPML